MADRLEHLKGSWLLSINDRPEVREIFGRFAIEAVITTYTEVEETRPKRAS